MNIQLVKQVSDQIGQLLEGMENNNKTSYFQSDEYNFDTKQNLNMRESMKQMEKIIESHKIDVNDYSIVDAKDYLGCLGNQCNNLGENTKNTKKFMDNNIDNINENTASNDNTKKNTNFINILDYIINFIYILLVTILLIYSILDKKNHNLIYIILLTLVFIFYKIFIKKS